MTARLTAVYRQALAALIALLLIGGTLLLAAPGQARADSAPLTPSPATPTTVTADGLPTAQHNGVAWSQVVVGDTVYVAGKFTYARPAGAAPGTQQVVRNNLMAYSISTGQMTDWAPSLNAQAMKITASPDGSRLYVGGDFTSVNGVARNRVAAFNTSTGALVSGFAPSVSSQVRAIAATDTTVYLGGSFGAVGGIGRNRLAAVSASTGALLPWAPQPGDGPTDGNSHPTANNDVPSRNVMDMVLTSGGSQVVVAGRFYTLNGADATGIGALDAVTGATRPFYLGTVITNQGTNSAIYGLSTDGANVYGTGYDFYGPGNLEGSFAVTADGGNVISINECHGDHYSTYPLNGVVYTAGHPYTCANIGGFPEENPRVNQFATAVTIAPQGVVGPNTFGPEMRGLPAAAVLPWFPTMSPGSYTGQWQAGWSVTGNDKYVVYGGEFPRVNGIGQQGLVRYAVPSLAPNKIGPTVNDGLTPTVVSLSAGTARVSWQATFDNDNENLVYRVVRNGNTASPVYQTTAASTFWNRPSMGFIDRDLTPGATYTYRVYAYDPFNNSATRGTTSVTISSDTSGGGLYADTVLADNPTNYWRLDGPAGATKAYDQAGFDDLNLGSGVTQGSAGALAGTSNTAADFNGTSDGTSATPSPVPGPQTFSVEAWFKTTTTSGGKIVGFGNSPTGNSSNYDRHVYMDDSGRVYFGVWLGWGATLQSAEGLNDGQWHQVVATVGPAGLSMYIDGQLVGSRSDATGAQDYSGYWRIGGDTAWAGSSSFFDGEIDEVAIYDAPLATTQVQRHFVVGSTGETFNEPPTASFTSSTDGLSASFDGSASADPDGSIAGYSWDFGDGTTASGATADHTFSAPGTYRVELTVTDSRGGTAKASRAVTVASTGTAGGAYSQAVLDSGAEHYWRFGETSGPVFDMAGTADLAVGSGVTRGTAGAIVGDADTAATFDGTGEGRASTQTSAPGPNAFTVEAWFKTTTTAGGKIVGYGNEPSGNSSNYDRHIYMDESGRLSFGVWTGAMSVVQSGTGLNDGEWHQVVGSLSSAGLSLYVDGQLVDSRGDITAGQPYDGFWRIGGDSSWAGANYFAGDIDDVAIYPVAMPAETVAQHYTLGSTEPPPNPAPVADFTSSVNGLTVDVDASASTDDGSIASYSWAFQGGGSGDGVSSSYTFGDTGTYDVTLTVTDNLGATHSVTKQVSVTAPPPNQAPEAQFASTVDELDVTVNASASTDGDGTLQTYAWDFGDGSSGTGVTAAHTYDAAGTYTITLTVTDDDGATDTATGEVTVAAPTGPPIVAADAFDRTVTGGFGSADVGGAWTSLYGSARQSVNAGTATLNLAAGSQSGTYLNSVSQTGMDLTSTVWLGQAPTGGGVNVLFTGRRVGVNQEYRLRMRFLANGNVMLGLTRLSGSSADVLIGSEVVLPGGAYVPGTPLRVRLNVSGTGTTQLAARVWAASAPEPATWTVSRTDATASLQAAGGIGVMAYLSATATTVPLAVNVAAWEARQLP